MLKSLSISDDEFLRWMLDRQIGWIAQAETKVAAQLTLNLAMVGGLAAAYAAAESKTLWSTGFSLATVFFLMVAFVCAIMCLKPRTEGSSSSLLFFGKVAEYSPTDYQQSLMSATSIQMLEDIAHQIYQNAKIAKIKHEWVSKGITYSFAAAFCWVIAISLLVRI